MPPSNPDREEKIKKLSRLLGEPQCKELHHPKKYQHRFDEDCPVEKEIKVLLLDLNN